MLDEVTSILGDALAAAIAAGGTEVDVVKNYVNAVASVPPGPGYNVRVGLIHQRPYAFFVAPPSVCEKSKCELGDILYVYKQLGPTGDAERASAVFIQAKKGNEYWHIEPHQLEFLANIRKICFRFGNSVYKRGGIKPKLYSGLAHTGQIGAYLLIGPGRALCYDLKRVKSKQATYHTGFYIHDENPIFCKEANRPLCENHDSHSKFLPKLFDGKMGANISGGVKDVVSLIYKRIGWIYDPPEEFADNFVEDGRPFAVIEVTAKRSPNLEGRQKHYRRG